MAINEEEVREEKERFVIDDDNKACWALKEIKKLQEKVAQKEELAKTQKRQIDEWLEDETKKHQESINYLESLLMQYGFELKKKDPKLKTHSLPFGDLRFRKQQPKWEYDDAKLLESVKEAELNEVIKIKESVNKAGLKKLVKKEKAVIENGQVIITDLGVVLEGVQVVDRPERFEVKVK